MLREEFDDWAVLFNPDAGLGFAGFGLNPTGVFVWKLLDGEHPIDDLLEELRDHAKDVPEDAREHIRVFVDALVAEGLAGYGDTGSYRELNELKAFAYEPPKLVNLSSGQVAQGDCNDHGSNWIDCCPGTGNCASHTGGQCCSGDCVTNFACDCTPGSSPTSGTCGNGNSTSGNCAQGCGPSSYGVACRCGGCPWNGWGGWGCADGVPSCQSGRSCGGGCSA